MAAKLAFNGWGQFVLTTFVLLVLLTVTINIDFLLLIFSMLLPIYIFTSLFLYVYIILSYSRSVGYRHGKYTFQFNQETYKEKTKLAEIIVKRETIKKVRFHKNLVMVYVSLGRRFALPRSEKLVTYLRKNYADKLS